MADPRVAIGIGASAGGLEAIERFFDHAPNGADTTYIIVQHLSPDHKSLMSELLARHTELPIREVEDGEQVAPGTIYLMPRKSNLTVFNGRLFLTAPQPGLNLPIDIFFRSLAEEYGERAVAVILSGTGSDGTRGVRAVKEAGGAVFVQDESTARFDGMPLSAIRTGIVDHILPPEEMPGRIAQLSASSGEFIGADEREASRPTISQILLLVKRKTGVDLTQYKPSTIYRRIERRIGITQSESVGQYLDLLREDPAEVTTLFKEILIGVTKFFRDPEAYDVLQEQVMPQIVDHAPADRPLRVWVPGCSTGEEAYSIAILLTEYMERRGISYPIRIFATDIDRDALHFASAGVYSESIAADASPERLRKYFVPRGEAYQIAPEIRESVVFAYHNVFNDPPFRKLDLVSCRNLLIYLEPVLQQRAIANFAFALDVGGFLFLGSSESVGDQARYFEPFDTRWKIFRSVEHRTQGEGPEKKRGGPLNDAIIEAALAPSVLVRSDRSVERIIGDVSPFLQLRAGRVDLKVTHLARDPISIPLGNTLERVIRTGRRDASAPVRGTFAGEQRTVSISVTPVTCSHDSRYLISFHDHPPVTDEDGAPFNLDAEARQRIHDLEVELLSSNEELQSINEELQSVNEELISVNSEYQQKIEELSLLNADVTNLLAASPAGIIFLDADARVRKYTPRAAEQFSIIRSDLGRPIVDLSHRLRYPEFHDDLESVTSSTDPRERTVESDDGRRYLVRILPYEEADGRRRGTVIGLVDITNHVNL